MKRGRQMEMGSRWRGEGRWRWRVRCKWRWEADGKQMERGNR